MHVPTEIARWAFSASMVYAAILVFRCPCDTLAACKFGRFLLVAGIPVAALTAWNVLDLMKSDAAFKALKLKFNVNAFNA